MPEQPTHCWHCLTALAEAAELRRLLEAARSEAGRLRPLAALVSGVLFDARDIPVADMDDVVGLHAGLRRLLADRDRLRGMVEGLCARVAAQSDLLSRRAEKVSLASGPAGVAVTEDDGDPE